MELNQQQPHQGQKRILIVDDEPDLTRLCSLALEYHKFTVDTFNDPKEALSNFRPYYYNLVILDIKMPKMDGFDLYGRLMRIDNELKVCFLTALGEFDEYYRRYKREDLSPVWGRRHIIRKPIDNSKLLEEVSIMTRKAG